MRDIVSRSSIGTATCSPKPWISSMAANLTRVLWRCCARPGRGRLETCPFRGVKRTFAKDWSLSANDPIPRRVVGDGRDMRARHRAGLRQSRPFNRHLRNGDGDAFRPERARAGDSFAASAFQDRLVLGAVVKLLRSFDRRKFRDY